MRSFILLAVLLGLVTFPRDGQGGAPIKVYEVQRGGLPLV